jgi:hypothetical protein
MTPQWAIFAGGALLPSPRRLGGGVRVEKDPASW